MPELAEVEVSRRLVEAHCLGRRITSVQCKAQRSSEALTGSFDDIVYTCTEAEATAALMGSKIIAACRKGKQLWWDLDTGKQLALHLGMSGSIAVRGVQAARYKRYEVSAESWPPRFTKLELGFEDGTALAFVNARRIGRIRLHSDIRAEKPVSELGFDPLTSPPSLEGFCKLLESRKGAIKAVLLDQSFSAGVGNWLADEICYMAKIHPARPVKQMADAQKAAVYKALLAVVRFACDVDADHTRFPPSWLFHVRWSKGKAPTSTKEGHPVAFETVGGRTTAVVAAIQGTKDWPKPAKKDKAASSPKKPAKKDKAASSPKKPASEVKLESKKSAGSSSSSAKPLAAAAAAAAGVAIVKSEFKSAAAHPPPVRAKRSRSPAVKRESAAVSASASQESRRVTRSASSKRVRGARA